MSLAAGSRQQPAVQGGESSGQGLLHSRDTITKETDGILAGLLPRGRLPRYSNASAEPSANVDPEAVDVNILRVRR